MSLLEHLEELRRRLIVIVIALVVGAAIGFALSKPTLDFLRAPLPDGYEKLYFTAVGGAFGVRLKIAIFLGIALAMPVILFEIWRFVTSGLTTRERRIVWPALIGGLALFVLGMGVGYLIIPYALTFLLSFAEPNLAPLLTVNEYIGFITTMMLAFGLIMEFPIVLIALTRVGVLSYRRVAAQRRRVIVGIVMFAVVITPGGDPLSPSILSVVMYILFEMSLVFMRITRR